MTIRNLDKLLAPASVAVIGASERAGSIGNVLTRNLLAGGFRGPVWGVNPRCGGRVLGIPCFASVAELPAAPDLAVIVTPAASAPELVAALGARGTRAAIVISATREDAGGAAIKTAILEAARPYTLRVVGPNCLGMMVPGIGLNTSFSHLAPLPGRLAFVTQSGAIVTSMIDWAHPRGIGFSHVLSLGDMSDVDIGDMLDYLANDPGTDAVLLYLESVSGARKFVSAARAAARTKPVIVVKGGRFAAGARAAATHTGALMGRDEVYDAVFRRTGMVRVYTLQELFNAAETLGRLRRLHGERLAILTNGGGLAVLAADALAALDGTLTALDETTIRALDALLPDNWSRANPVDVIGDADPQRLARAAAIVAADRNVDALLVVHCPTAVCPGEDAARALIDALAGRRTPELLTSWVGGATALAARDVFAAAGIPTYPTPEQAIRGFMHAVAHARGQRILMETPELAPETRQPEIRVVAELLAEARRAGREWLDAEATRRVLQAYGFETIQAFNVDTAEEAATAASRIGAPVALKIRSPDIPHKTDFGGVVLDLADPGATRAAAEAMRTSIAARLPQARIEGFCVERMVHRPGAYELLLGMSPDPQFGPVLVFGQGGTATETIADTALALPPLNMHLARALIARTHIARLLGGARGKPAANLDAIALALVRLSELVCDFPQIAELDINPLLADAHDVVVLDARIRLDDDVTASGPERLAIKPYPRELEEDVPLADGRVLWLRPVLPEDEPSLRRAFADLTPEEIYLRFFAPIKAMSHAMATRFTQIDYDRQMVLLLTGHGAPGTSEFYGSVNIVCDPDLQRAEYAILVRHDMTGMGLGGLLMRRIIAYAKRRGIGEIFGEVLAQNHNMLNLCTQLGFRIEATAGDPGVVTVRLDLRGAGAG
ncbi:MAG: Protein lysine acetyltransferase Pat [Pseudomonadales bacterium]|nr:Protein lysine acetyltransferase Pat [Pseudomonadales bacterium]